MFFVCMFASVALQYWLSKLDAICTIPTLSLCSMVPLVPILLRGVAWGLEKLLVSIGGQTHSPRNKPSQVKSGNVNWPPPRPSSDEIDAIGRARTSGFVDPGT